MVTQYTRHELLLRPETFEERMACTHLASKTLWGWDGAAKFWRIPRFALDALPEKITKYVPKEPEIEGHNETVFSLLSLPPHLTPYPYQRPEILNLASGKWGLWASCGVGKTLCALAAYYVLKKRGSVDGMIVVGPEPGRHVWCGEDSDAQKWIHTPGEYVKTGQKTAPTGEIVYITAAKIFRDPYMKWVADKIRTKRWVLCVDEADRAAGALTQRFAVLENWAKYCSYIWLLTATPVRNYPDSFWGLYTLLTGHKICYHVWCEWLRNKKKKGWDQDRVKAIGKALSHCTSVVSKEDVAPWLPPVTNHTIKVPMKGRQRELYTNLVASGRMTLAEQGGKERTVVVKELLHSLSLMASISSHPIVAKDDEWKDNDIAKLPYLEHILKSHHAEKVCIWSWHPAVLDWLHSKFPESVRYHGGVGRNERTEAVRRFNNDDSIRFFFGNPMSAGSSLNLGAGTVRIYWDLGWSWSEYHQSCERINRITRKLPLTGYVLMSERTVEEVMWKAINGKMDLASMAMSGTDATGVFKTQVAEEILDLWKR